MSRSLLLHSKICKWQQPLVNSIPSACRRTIEAKPCNTPCVPEFCTMSIRCLSSWSGKGYDLFEDLDDSNREPRIILEGYSSSGFDVLNVIENIQKTKSIPENPTLSTKMEQGEKETDTNGSSGTLHMMGSIMAFPNACFLWKVRSIEEVTLESLAPVILYRPKLHYLFIGTERPMEREAFHLLKTELSHKYDIAMEQLGITNALGTFNILNQEERSAALVVVLDDDDSK